MPAPDLLEIESYTMDIVRRAKAAGALKTLTPRIIRQRAEEAFQLEAGTLDSKVYKSAIKAAVAAALAEDDKDEGGDEGVVKSAHKKSGKRKSGKIVEGSSSASPKRLEEGMSDVATGALKPGAKKRTGGKQPTSDSPSKPSKGKILKTKSSERAEVSDDNAGGTHERSATPLSKSKQPKAASPDSPDDRLAQAAVDKGHHPKVVKKRKHPDDGDGTFSSSPKRSKPGATEASEVESPEPKRKEKGKQPDVPSSNLLKGKESASKLVKTKRGASPHSEGDDADSVKSPIIKARKSSDFDEISRPSGTKTSALPGKHKIKVKEKRMDKEQRQGEKEKSKEKRISEETDKDRGKGKEKYEEAKEKEKKEKKKALKTVASKPPKSEDEEAPKTDTIELSDEDQEWDETKPDGTTLSSAANPSKSQRSPDSKKASPSKQTDGPVDAEKSETELSVLIDEPIKRKRKKETKKDPENAKSVPKKTKKLAAQLPKDDETIKRLKSLVAACGMRKVWSKEFQGLDTPKSKIKRLKEILTELGMEGRMSMEQAKAIRAKRELAQELADVISFERAVVAKDQNKEAGTSGRRASDESQNGSEGEEEGGATAKRPSTAARSIMAFLADQSESE